MSGNKFRLGDVVSIRGEIVELQSESMVLVRAWIVRPDGTYTVCPIAGLKAI